MTDALAYYAKHGAALFPIPAGQKAPFGIVGSFKHDHAKDPTTWKAWRSAHPQCNFGVVAFASQWIILDTDVKPLEGQTAEEARNEAWTMRGELFSAWGLDRATLPHIQSARGGWHDYFKVPEGVDASQLRQPDAIKKRINIRCVGFTVAAGSHFEGRPYLQLSDASPHPAPAALVEHCTRGAARPLSTSLPGSRDKGDVSTLLTWLSERGAFEDYESWFQVGMALRLEYGDDGFELWDICHDNTVSPETAAAKWQSFATEPTADSVTLSTFLDRAHKLGWRGSVRKSTAAMFEGVAASAGIPMLARGDTQAKAWAPILAAVPHAARLPEHPLMPDTGHPLRDAINAAIPAILAGGHPDALAVIEAVHPETAALVGTISPAVKARAEALRQDAEHALAPSDFTRDHKGSVEKDNPDNVRFFLSSLSIQVRFNSWLERIELQGWKWPRWTPLTDSAVAALMTRAAQTGTRFTPAIEFFWRTVQALADENAQDPALELLSSLEKGWDKTPRLANWLAHTCGTPPDLYHQAVSNLIIGGMVRRIRQPGCKHDVMPVLLGPQGTGKSTIAKIIADMGQSTLVEIDSRSAPYFSDEVRLGDESKEMVLSLAGKCLVEISEMGQRNATKIDDIKAMLSRQVDRGRTAYARAVTERPRRNIFFGTVNGDEPLSDESGNRRFLPISVPDALDLRWLSENIRNLVGEAAALHSQGADFSLPREVWNAATVHQEAARAQSDFEIHLEGWFPTPGPDGYVTAKDLTDLLKDAIGRSLAPKQYGKTMRRLGFEQDQKSKVGRVWVRGAGGTNAARWAVSRDGSGRAVVKQMFAGVTGKVA